MQKMIWRQASRFTTSTVLRLAFHAYANNPPRPYQDAPVKKLLSDLELVNAQIRRFAGPDTFSPVVVVHWGMTRPAAWKRVVNDPHQGEIIDFLTHEQYFWPFYRRYLPDHAERMERAIAFVTERRYKPVFLQDGFLGNPAIQS